MSQINPGCSEVWCNQVAGRPLAKGEKQELTYCSFCALLGHTNLQTASLWIFFFRKRRGRREMSSRKIKHEGKNERKKEAWADEKVKEAKGRSSKSYSPPTPTPKLWWARQPTPKATIYLSSSPSFGWYCLSKRNEVPTGARPVRPRSMTLVVGRQKFFQASPRRSLFSSQANRIGFYVLIFRSF